MQALLRLSGWIDALNTRVGKAVIWLVLAAALVSAGNAAVRKAFDWSSNALLEIQWYFFSAIFLLGAGYVLLKNQHVRIDVIAGRLSPRAQNRIDVFGLLFFLLPMAGLLAWLSWPLFVDAWQSGEVSSNPGGLVRWPARLLMPVGFLLLALQGLSELVKRVAFLAGHGADPLRRDEGADAEAELAEAIRQHLVAGEVADQVEQAREMAADDGKADR